MIDLRTPEELYQYCVDRNILYHYSPLPGLGKKACIRHLTLLLETLKPDEEMECVFVAYRNEDGLNGTYAFALTGRRFLMAQEGRSGPNVDMIGAKHIRDITLNQSMTLVVNQTIRIDTSGRQTLIEAPTEIAPNIYECLRGAWDLVREKLAAAAAAAGPQDGPVDLRAELQTPEEMYQYCMENNLSDDGYLRSKIAKEKKSSISLYCWKT